MRRSCNIFPKNKSVRHTSQTRTTWAEIRAAKQAAKQAAIDAAKKANNVVDARKLTTW